LGVVVLREVQVREADWGVVVLREVLVLEVYWGAVVLWIFFTGVL
jgi:hypothetical protein